MLFKCKQKSHQQMSTTKSQKQNERELIEMYGRCEECGVILSDHIYIMSKKPKWNFRNNRGHKEETVCSQCRHNLDWSEGWEDDEQWENE